MYLVIARIVARPERRKELADLLAQFAAATRQEPGCNSYAFTADVEDENAFSSIEVWDDEAALVVHLGTPELAEASKTLQDLVAAPLVITGYEVAGEPTSWA